MLMCLFLVIGIHEFNRIMTESANLAADDWNNSHAYCEVEVNK